MRGDALDWPLPDRLSADPEPGARQALSICVFCASRPGASPSVLDAADRLGAAIAARGHRLVYGGSGVGLMGVVAWAAHRAAGQIIGVIPGFLREWERQYQAPEQTLVVTESLFDRKREMLRRSDAFIALPGGFGTLDEVLEVASLKFLGLQHEPLVLLNLEGAWNRLIDLFGDIRARGFAPFDDDQILATADTPERALDLVEAAARAAGTGTAGRRLSRS